MEFSKLCTGVYFRKMFVLVFVVQCIFFSLQLILYRINFVLNFFSSIFKRSGLYEPNLTAHQSVCVWPTIFRVLCSVLPLSRVPSVVYFCFVSFHFFFRSFLLCVTAACYLFYAQRIFGTALSFSPLFSIPLVVVSNVIR